MLKISAIRDLVDIVKRVYGEERHIRLYEDGSGFICDNESGENIVDFDGLGELHSMLGD